MIEQLKLHFKNIILDNNYYVITIDAQNIIQSVYLLYSHKNFYFKTLIDIFGIDYPNKKSRFEINYNLLSIKYNKRIIIKITTTEDKAIKSLTSLFDCANWYEREVFDMYGIKFINHPKLQKILTDYNFNGYPMRKDFPLSGYTEVSYNDKEKKVIYKPVKLDQEYRNFETLSPWQEEI